MNKLCRYLMLIAVIAFNLSACGGGGSTGSSSSTGTSSGGTTTPLTVQLSGNLTFESFKPTESSGLDYSNPTDKPIRGAVVELRTYEDGVIGAGTLVAQTNSSENGDYSFTVTANSSYRVFVKAALGEPGNPNTKVVHNTFSDALYSMYEIVAAGDKDTTLNLHASSGWDGSSYSGGRYAAPFSILDVIYQAQQTVVAADSTVDFNDADNHLIVNWSTFNKPVEGDASKGEIITSHYSSDDGELYILGAENIDTDEYDTAIIAHEWSHYFEAKLSRSDSFGGDHAWGEIMDMTLAFGEGFGTAMGGMILGNPEYIDTTGVGQKTVDIYTNLEADSQGDDEGTGKKGVFESIRLDGFYSEISVMEILWDLYDGGSNDIDNDGVELGLSPILKVMLTGQKDTPAFTSIFSFMYYLKQQNPSYVGAITDVFSGENITWFADEYQSKFEPIYNEITFDGVPLVYDLQGYFLRTFANYGEITDGGDNNKFRNRVYFKGTVPTDDCYTLSIIPDKNTSAFFEGNGTFYAFFAGKDRFLEPDNPGEMASHAFEYKAGEVVAFSVASEEGERIFTVTMTSTPTACTQGVQP